MDIVSYALLFIFGLILYLFFFKKSSSKPYPPGPRGWDLLRATVISLNGTLPLHLEGWHRKYGDVVFCPFPMGSMLFLNTPTATKELYAGKSTEKFVNDRMWSYPADHLCQRKCVVFSSPSDPEWSKMRKLMHASLKFYGEGVAEFEQLVSEILDKTIASLDTKSGQDLVMIDVVEDFITATIGMLLVGEALEPDSELCQSIKWLNRSIVRTVDPSFSLVVWILPFLDHIPGTTHYKARQELVNSKRATMDLVLGTRRGALKPGTRPGILDKVLEYQRNAGADWMTDEYIEGFLLDIVAAGINTSKFTLNTQFFHLLHYPHTMRAIQDELDRVVGLDRKPELSDRPSCNYTEAFILESMRMVTLLPMGLDHMVSQDVEFRGHLIPKGTVAFTAAYAYNKSPTLWEDPHSFKPERFLDKEGRLLPPNHPTRQSLLDFGAGKRSCVGEAFARARLFLFLTGILQVFDVLPPVQEKLLPMGKESWVWGVKAAFLLKPYRCTLRRRRR